MTTDVFQLSDQLDDDHVVIMSKDEFEWAVETHGLRPTNWMYDNGVHTERHWFDSAGDVYVVELYDGYNLTRWTTDHKEDVYE